jgi:Transaldolase/Fructose-6-phosphate aldolase
MKIFLDTANVTQLREGVAMGLVDGCTTNPSLIAKEKRPVRPLLEEICSIVPGDVSLEVVASDFEGMMKEGKELAQVATNVVVKCPLTRDGLKAVKHLSGEGSGSIRRSASRRLRRCCRPRPERRTSAPFSDAWTISAPSAWTWCGTSARSTGTSDSRGRYWRRRSVARSTCWTQRRRGRMWRRCRSRCWR